MERIGLFGGTFDPVHSGHLYAAEQVMTHVELDTIDFMPSATPPHKNGVTYSSAEDRLHMLCLALQGHPRFRICTVELEHPELRYSVDTLSYLKMAYPEREYFFIMGGDSLMYIEKWFQAERLLRENRFISVYRPDSTAEAQLAMAEKLRARYDAHITLVECEGLDISSTAIRQAAREEGMLEQYTGVSVAAYIREKGLYR